MLQAISLAGRNHAVGRSTRSQRFSRRQFHEHDALAHQWNSSDASQLFGHQLSDGHVESLRRAIVCLAGMRHRVRNGADRPTASCRCRMTARSLRRFVGLRRRTRPGRSHDRHARNANRVFAHGVGLYRCMADDRLWLEAPRRVVPVCHDYALATADMAVTAARHESDLGTCRQRKHKQRVAAPGVA